MKILIAADTYYPHVNGASYFAQRLAFCLQQRGHRVLVIAPSRTFQSEVYDRKVKGYGDVLDPHFGLQEFSGFSSIFVHMLIRMIDKRGAIQDA